MTISIVAPAFDGTTGRGDHPGRRTDILRILRDAKGPMTVEQVAERAELPTNAARAHLESLVDCGLAVRRPENRTTPGRPRMVYKVVMPTQTHARAYSYRLLAQIIATAVAQANPNGGEWMYNVGRQWGHFLITREADPDADEQERLELLLSWLETMWFAPEVQTTDPPRVTLHSCPFAEAARRYPSVICQLHGGMINGACEAMGAGHRLVRLRAHQPGHKCECEFARTTSRMAKVPYETGEHATAAIQH
jgi:predicted ArsR family transcriptional regulator